MPTNPPANPLPGAVYVDQLTNIAWVWTGTYWLQAKGGSSSYNAQVLPTTAIIPGYYASPSPEEWIPHVGTSAPANPGCGLIWIDTTNPLAYSASVWDCNTGTWLPLAGTGVDTNAVLISALPPTQRSMGNALVTGDLWIDPVNQELSYWNGAAFISVSTPDTHSVFSSTAPATRADGNLLVAGDLWTDPDNNRLHYYDGATWIPVSAVAEIHQIAAVPPTIRVNTDPLVTGDLWTDTAGNILHYWDGANWVPLGDLHAFAGSGVPVLATRPNGTALVEGDQYFDDLTNDAYYWNGTSWKLLSDKHSFVGAGVPALAVRPNGTPLITGDQYIDNVSDQGYYWDGGAWVLFGADTHCFRATSAPATRPNGTSLQDGDMWVDTDNNNLLYVYNLGTTSFELISKDTHSFVGAGAPALVTRPDGSALVAGDQYINSTSNQGYYWDGGASWVLFGADTHCFRSTSAPATRPNGTALQDGDMWVDTDNNNLLYVYNLAGTAWQLASTDSNSFVDSVEITTRPDGTPLKNGDQLYLTTTTPWTLKYYNLGLAQWVGTLNQPLIDKAVDPVNGVDTAYDYGTVWLNTSTGAAFEYVAPQLWNPLTHRPNVQVTTAVQPTTQSNGLPLVNGDIYFDRADGLSYIWSTATSEWLPLGQNTNSIVNNNEPVLRPNGFPLQTGDVWTDTSMSPSPQYFWDGLDFKPTADLKFITTLPATGDYLNEVYVQTSNNKMYRWSTGEGNGSVWIQVV